MTDDSPLEPRQEAQHKINACQQSFANSPLLPLNKGVCFCEQPMGGGSRGQWATYAALTWMNLAKGLEQKDTVAVLIHYHFLFYLFISAQNSCFLGFSSGFYCVCEIKCIRIGLVRNFIHI